MMITRATDMVRETSNAQRQPDVSQQHLATQSKVDSVHNQSKVAATLESEMESIRTDVDGGGSGAASSGGSDHDEEHILEDLDSEMLVAPAEHDQIIDIIV